MTFSDCLRSHALEIYQPLKSSDPNEDLEVFFRNQDKLFACAIESELGNESTAYEHAFQRERSRILASLGAKRCQVPDLEERLSDLRAAFWRSRPVLVEEINQRRLEAARNHARGELKLPAFMGAVLGGLVGIGVATVARSGIVGYFIMGLGASFVGANAGSSLGFQSAASDFLESQGGLIDPLREGTRDEEAPRAIFDSLELQDAEKR